MPVSRFGTTGGPGMLRSPSKSDDSGWPRLTRNPKLALSEVEDFIR